MAGTSLSLLCRCAMSGRLTDTPTSAWGRPRHAYPALSSTSGTELSLNQLTSWNPEVEFTAKIKLGNKNWTISSFVNLRSRPWILFYWFMFLKNSYRKKYRLCYVYILKFLFSLKKTHRIVCIFIRVFACFMQISSKLDFNQKNF
jgi:hypothetical protein